MLLKRVAVDLVLAIAVIGLAFAALAWRPSIAPVASPGRATFPQETIAKGAVLASAGFCGSCHTPPGGAAYSGGKPLATPFGTIYGSNITPDPQTGIGTWSLAAFTRAMRDGVDAAGHHLYPAFPYNHFTQLGDDDIAALYAFVMTREPVRAATPAPDLPFPYNLRPLLAGWKLLFLKEGALALYSTQSAAMARGAYLSEALAHCGACHTPRNSLGAEIAGQHYAGGEAEGWWAPPLDRSTPASVPWDQGSLAAYLGSWDRQHGGAVGPMMPVVEGLAKLPPADIAAIATYTLSQMGSPPPERLARTRAVIARGESDLPPDAAVARGGTIYAGACASCHDSGGAVPFTVGSLAQHSTLWGPDPRNVVNVVLQGVGPRSSEAGAIMPAFADSLTDAQLADLLAYLRARFSDAPPWPDPAKAIRAARAAPKS